MRTCIPGNSVGRSGAIPWQKALFAAAMLCVAAQAQSLPYGDFTDGFITLDEDTIPMGWGDSGFKMGCCLYFDMVTYHDSLGAARVEGCTDTCAWGFSSGVTNPEASEGQTVTLSGWVKLQDVVGQAIVGLQTGCGCGGWQKVEWKEVWVDSGTMDWTLFSGTIDLPPISWCDAQYSLTCITLTVHLDMRGTGTFWADDLVVTGPTGTRYHVGSRSVLPDELVVAGANRVSFNRPTSYTVALVRPDGQVVGRRAGYGTSARLVPPGTALGTYLSVVESAEGRTARRIVVPSRGR